MNVEEFIAGLRARGQEEAYWNAMERVFGTTTSKVLKALLLAKAPVDERAEWQRVAHGLAGLLQWQAHAVDTLAHRSEPVGQPRPWREALGALGLHDHLLQFGEGTEGQGIFEFLSLGLQRGAKAVCGCRERDMPAIRLAMVERGYGKHLDSGGLTFVVLDGLVRAAEAEGSINPIIDNWRDEGLEAALESSKEMWVTGCLSSLLYNDNHRDLAKDIEAWCHRQSVEQPLVIHCTFPTGQTPDPGDLLSLTRNHNWVTCGPRSYPLNLSAP